MSALVALALARARRRPGRFLVTSLGIAVAVAYGGAVLTEATIAGDQAARNALAQSSTLARTVRVDWSGPASPSVAASAQRTLSGFGLHTESRVVLMSPVRLNGVVVQLAAITPDARWLAGARPLGPCGTSSCPMLLVGGRLTRGALSAPGIRLPIAGSARLRSAAPLGFLPASGQPPVLITGDAGGLDRLAALAGLSRTNSWLSVLAAGSLNSWSLAAIEGRLQRAQLALTGAASGFNFTAPFDALDAGRARARAATRGLLLADGGALAALAVFVVLAGGALRRDVQAEHGRLALAGSRRAQSAAFVLLEAGWISGVAVAAGGAAALGLGALLASGAGVPVPGAVRHGLLTTAAAAGAAGAWIACTVLLAALTGLTRRALVALADALAVAAVAALVVGLALGGSSRASALLLAPLACLAAGLLLVRGVGLLLRASERLTRRGWWGSPLPRVAALGLARGPGLASIAVAFIAISVGLGGFALSYRATLQRSAADQAADRVPLDALVAPGSSFIRPLQVASLSSWRGLAGGTVLAVRRTEASYLKGGETATVPALGVPATGLELMHGWRGSDGSVSLSKLARRLVPPGAERTPGPELPASTRWLSVAASSAAGGVEVSADLRSLNGLVDQVALGQAIAGSATLSAAVPPGHWELEALELDVPAGVQTTNAHQNAENPAPPGTATGIVRVGAAVALDRRRRPLEALRLSGWRGVGAASAAADAGAGLEARFAQSGNAGVLRPPQPSDRRPLPVLADPTTAAVAGRRGQLPLTIDGLPVRGHVVGVLKRFPTLAADAGGFVVADEATLAATLDAQQPGQGQPDELWLSSTRLGPLHAALARGPLAQLQSSFRADIARSLNDDPVARGVLGSLIAATAIALALAVAGMLAVLLGAARDRRVEGDLAGLGVGPRGLRAELRMRLSIAAMTGVIAGGVVAVVLTGLAVGGVGSALGAPRPAVVAVVPAGALALWVLGAFGALAVTGFLATTSTGRRA